MTPLNAYNEDTNRHKPVVEQVLTDARKAAIKNELMALVDDELYALSEAAEDHIASVATDRANRFLTKVLEGDPEAGKALIGAGDQSRYRVIGHDEGKPWACLIHGNLFTVRPVEIRQKIVEQHGDLLRTERIRDLESVVDGLTRQLQNAEREIDRLRSELNF